MPAESVEEGDVELIGDGEEDEKTSYAGHFPLPGTVPKGIEDRLTTWLNLTESSDPFVERKYTRKLNNYAYDVASKRVGAGLGENEMKAFLKQYPKLDVTAVFEWNAAFLMMTDVERMIKWQEDLWEALEGTLYKKSKGSVRNPWLRDYYFKWQKTDGANGGGDLSLERGDWEPLTVRVERELDDIMGGLWQVLTVPVLKPLCPGFKDAYIKRMNKLMLEKPDEAMKMQTMGRGFR